MTALFRWSGLLGVVAVFSATFTGLRRYFAFREARWIELDLRDRLFAHVQRLHFAFHDRVQTGQLMSRANTDLQQVQAFLVMIPLTISNGVTVLAVTVILATIDPVLTLLALASLPFLNVMATRFSRRLAPQVMGIQRESAELAAVVEETVAGVRVVKGLGAEAVQAKRLKAEADDVYTQSMAAARTRASFVPALELLPNIGFIAVLAYGGHQVIDGQLSLGSLIAFNVYITMLIWPLRMLGMIVAQAQRAVVSAERVDEVLATDPQIADPAHPSPLLPGGGEVRFEGVRFGYGGPGVLDDFDLRIAPGESVALVGATGLGEIDGRPAAGPVLRRGRGHDPARRPRRARAAPAPAAGLGRHRLRGHVPLQRHDRRQHRLRRPRDPARRDRAGGAPGRGTRFRGEPARGLRHGDRRAGVLALGRAAPAHRHRPGHPRRPPHPGARRRHLGRRPHQGARDPRRPVHGHGGAHHDRHRPPAGHDRAGRPGGAARRRPGGGRGHPRRPAGHRGPLPGGSGGDRRRRGPRRRLPPGGGRRPGERQRSRGRRPGWRRRRPRPRGGSIHVA